MLTAKQLTQNLRLIHLCKIRDILCEEVPKYEAIFNGQHPDHCNNLVTDAMWEKFLTEVKNKNVIMTSKLKQTLIVWWLDLDFFLVTTIHVC